MKRFEFVDRERAHYTIARLCEVLEVSTSGYCAWKARRPSRRAVEDDRLLYWIRRIYEDNERVYGAPKVHADLRASGIRCGRKRVARLMKAEGLVGCHRRHRINTTRRDPKAAPAADLVSRQFRSLLPNRLWVADITYVPTREGFLYLAVVMDVFSRRVVGHSMGDHIDAQLVTDALDMAIWMRRPKPGLIHHSDRGRQYTSVTFGARCQEAKVVPSMGAAGDCYDNAMAESFFATLECELLDRRRFQTRLEAEVEIFRWIEDFYNRRRRHSSLGYDSPENYERRHALTGEWQSSFLH